MPGFIGEDANYFTYEGPDGRPLPPIAKAGLSPETIASYRAQLPAPPPAEAAPETSHNIRYLPSAMEPAPAPLPDEVAASLPPAPKSFAPSMALDLGRPAPVAVTAPAAELQPKASKLAPEQLHFSAPSPPQAGGPLGAAQSAMTGSIPRVGDGGASRAERLGEKALNEQQAAQAQAVQLGQQKAAEEYGYRQAAMEHAAKLDAQETEMRGAYQRDYTQKMAEFQKATDAYANTSTAVDTNRVWSNMDTGSRVLAGIGLALGAIGAGGNGGRNMAVETIDKAIDRDIDAQKAEISANLQKRGNVAAQKQNLLGMMREKFGDDVQADAAARAAMWKNVGAQIDGLGSKFQSIPEASQQALAALQAEKDGKVAALQEQAAQRQQELSQKNAMLGMEGQKLDIEKAKANAYLAKVGAGKAQPYSSAPALERLKAAAKNANTSPHEYDDAVNAYVLAASKDYNNGKPAKPATVEMFRGMLPSRFRTDGAIDKGLNRIGAVLREGRGQSTAGEGAPGDGEEG